jgi:hypothetical protein
MKRPLVATALVVVASCGTSEGVFHATWSLMRANGSASSCAFAGADTVAVRVHEQGAASYQQDDFVCSDLAGTTPPYAYAAYDVTLVLIAGGATLESAPSVTLHMNADTLDLPTAVFTF